MARGCVIVAPASACASLDETVSFRRRRRRRTTALEPASRRSAVLLPIYCSRLCTIISTGRDLDTGGAVTKPPPAVVLAQMGVVHFSTTDRVVAISHTRTDSSHSQRLAATSENASQYVTKYILYESSGVAGQLCKSKVGRKVGAAVPLSVGGPGSPSNTM